MSATLSAQRLLRPEQLTKFYQPNYVGDQVSHFRLLTEGEAVDRSKRMVDIGGGFGFFAKAFADATGMAVRVVDTDPKSIAKCRDMYGDAVEAALGDALSPDIRGDEAVVCFNLILHHLVADTEAETLALQRRALLAWKGKTDYIFVNEYAYESYLPGFSGRAIFEITKSKILSAIGGVVSKFVRPLRANTFGVGVRFRSHDEWVRIFNDCGFDVIAKTYGEPEPVALARRALLIRSTTRDSFLLKAR